MAESPLFLSSPGGGNTGTGKNWKTHLPRKALPLCSSHRCKSHTPAYRAERHTGNPSLSRLHKVRRCIHSPSRCCHKSLAPGQDCSTWVCSHCMLNLGQSLGLSTNLFPMQIVNALTLSSNSLQLQLESLWSSESPASTGCCAVKTRAKLQQHRETGRNIYQLLVTSTYVTGEQGMEQRWKRRASFSPWHQGMLCLGTREGHTQLSWRVVGRHDSDICWVKAQDHAKDMPLVPELD